LVLIGIVKKNAMMMTDFCAGRAMRPRIVVPRRYFPSLLLRFCPIMTTPMTALLAFGDRCGRGRRNAAAPRDCDRRGFDLEPNAHAVIQRR
jgi:hypothetical protein